MMERINTKLFRKDFVSAFAGDDSGNLKPRQTPDVFWAKAVPTPVKEVKLLAWSDDLAKELGIEKPVDQKEIDVFGGNSVTSSMYPYAARYGGHQFGNWAGQLGDGRAIVLGEWVAPGGTSYELQLKGAGPTAYSRRADGRAVLRSSIREYLMSEAMHYLGVPTTRALSLVSTGDQVLRDMFYDGHPEYEPGAIVMRVAPTFLRFGNYEVYAARGEMANLKKLVDWTINRYYSHIQGEGEEKLLAWFSEVVERTARLMVEWMRVGFVHGVMNTDNMSILGLSIDYGPYSFVDDYDLNFTPNTTDLPGRRYAFGKQPSVAYWNLGCLAGAIAPLFKSTDELQKALDNYQEVYWKEYYQMMGRKLGLANVGEEDVSFINEWTKLLANIKPDMTIFYQLLIHIDTEWKEKGDFVNHFKESFYHELNDKEQRSLHQMMMAYIKRLKKNTIDRKASQKIMKAANPRFILRNYILSQAIDEMHNGVDTLFNKLQQAIKEPYSNKWDEFFAKRPEWATSKAGCSMLSCSS
jgi:serine/tyrosine/threonine adenylyltransferase